MELFVLDKAVFVYLHPLFRYERLCVAVQGPLAVEGVRKNTPSVSYADSSLSEGALVYPM